MKPRPVVVSGSPNPDVSPYLESIDGRLLTEQARGIYRSLNPADKKLDNIFLPFTARTCAISAKAEGIDMGVIPQQERSTMAIVTDLDFLSCVIARVNEERTKRLTAHHLVLSAATYTLTLQMILNKIEKDDPYPSLVHAWGWVGFTAMQQMKTTPDETKKVYSGYREEAIQRQEDYMSDMMVVAQDASYLGIAIPRIQKPVPWLGIAYPQPKL